MTARTLYLTCPEMSTRQNIVYLRTITWTDSYEDAMRHYADGRPRVIGYRPCHLNWLQI